MPLFPATFTSYCVINDPVLWNIHFSLSAYSLSPETFFFSLQLFVPHPPSSSPTVTTVTIAILCTCEAVLVSLYCTYSPERRAGTGVLLQEEPGLAESLLAHKHGETFLVAL